MEKKKKYIFFSMNDFKNDGGGPIRMYGVMNALAINGCEVIFFSNTKDYSNFNDKIKHIYIDYKFNPNQKRLFQAILTYSDYKGVNVVFKNFFLRLKTIFKDLENQKVYFFEYLDNSIGYWAKKNKLIGNYVNDIHGIATLEFDYQQRNATSFIKKRILYFKKKSAYYLDKKVLINAKSNIYSSKGMKDYFLNLYPKLKNKDFSILNNLLLPNAKPINRNIQGNIKLKNELEIEKDYKVIFFAGSFKLTGGVINLIKAYEKVKKDIHDIHLVLIGDGYERINCENYVNSHSIEDISFLGRRPYTDLPKFLSLADIIVCPDTDNEFSKLIIHIKYINALMANKIIINGSFPSVREINIDEKLSLEYEPSNIDSLSETIKYSLNNYEKLNDKYKNTAEYALANYSYIQHVHNI